MRSLEMTDLSDEQNLMVIKSFSEARMFILNSGHRCRTSDQQCFRPPTRWASKNGRKHCFIEAAVSQAQSKMLLIMTALDDLSVKYNSGVDLINEIRR